MLRTWARTMRSDTMTLKGDLVGVVPVFHIVATAPVTTEVHRYRPQFQRGLRVAVPCEFQRNLRKESLQNRQIGCLAELRCEKNPA